MPISKKNSSEYINKTLKTKNTLKAKDQFRSRASTVPSLIPIKIAPIEKRRPGNVGCP